MLLRHARLATLTFPLALAVLLAFGVAAGTPANASAFEDTDGTSAQEAIDALAAEGVFDGCRDGEFCPEEVLTRAQAATVLVAALELPTGEALLTGATTSADGVVATEEPASLDDLTSFEDIDGSVHEESIIALAAAGITQGCEEDAFCPHEDLTRGQLATMIAEAFEVEATDIVWFDDDGDTHGAAINALATAGIAAGCSDPLPSFCTHAPVLRSHTAMFLARAMDLVPRVEISSLEERQEQQAAIDAEEAAKAEAEAAAREAEEEAAAAAERLAIWEALAQCESGGNWSINTGNGYYGGLQFHIDTWRSVGGTGYPHEASKEEQIYRAEILLARSGWGQWPACTLKLGYR